MLEHGIWREDPGKGQLLAANIQPEGMGVRNSTTGKVCERSPCCHRSKAPFLSGAQGVGLPLHPLPHALASSSTGTRRGACLSRLMCPSCQSLLQPHQPWWACVSCPSPPPSPPTWEGMFGKMPVGRTDREVGLKPQLSPRCHATKEED